MTTIAYDHKAGNIAVDSRTTADGIICTDEAIKYREHNNEIWFFCGSTSDVDSLLGMQHDHKPEVKPCCAALRVANGDCYLVTFNGDHCAHTKLTYDYAMGSGGDFALAAMDHGKSAKQAVEYAKTRDNATGGQVKSYSIKQAKFT